MLQDELRAVGAGDPELCGVASSEKRLRRNALGAPCLTGRAAEHGYEQGSGETPPNAMAGRTHMPSIQRCCAAAQRINVQPQAARIVCDELGIERTRGLPAATSC